MQNNFYIEQLQSAQQDEKEQDNSVDIGRYQASGYLEEDDGYKEQENCKMDEKIKQSDCIEALDDND